MGGLSVLCAALALLFAGSPAAAQSRSQIYGGWMVDRSVSGYVSVRTSNPTGPLFGMMCQEGASRGGCFYYLSDTINCESGAKYPMMMNNDVVGSVQVITTCVWVGNLQYLKFDETSVPVLNSIIRANGVIGIAVPLQGGDFKVTIFQTYGAQTALNAADIVFPGDAPRQ